LRLVVGDDGVRHPELMDDVGEERYDLFRPEVCDRVHLDPFRELIDGD
jgi:hypothetical protein